MDRAEQYPDPLGEALSHSSSRAAQMISLAAAAAEVAARRVALRNARQAAHDEQVRRALHDAERAARERARVGWAPALDARWLAQSDLLQVAGVWGAAAAYADGDPAAATALRKSEERLRTLHPYAMARYDRLREDGASPLDAMCAAAPLFVRAPHARPGDPCSQRAEIGAGTGNTDTAPVDNDGLTDRSAVRLAAESFPGTVGDGIKAAAAGTMQQSARTGRQSRLLGFADRRASGAVRSAEPDWRHSQGRGLGMADRRQPDPDGHRVAGSHGAGLHAPAQRPADFDPLRY